LKTFVDDPLRVLRTIRFAQRFNLKISEDIYEAARDPKVRQAFEHKVAFERIMVEMDKIFSNYSPHIAL
jgi:tRNA nucleotidyltransferase (CCA-adding enzyme)